MVTDATSGIRAKRSKRRAQAKSMRRLPTEAERLFWFHVRGHKLKGYKFKRQPVIEDYIVDFACLDKRLIVELDGGIHLLRETKDKKREARLIEAGYRIMRFENWEVMHRIEDVLRTVLFELEGR